MIVLKLLNMTHYRFDSDESQHMHVIWAWARGFVQYRDVFDNHMPAFPDHVRADFRSDWRSGDHSLLDALHLVADVLVEAWCTYRIGELLFSRRTGIWAVILAGLYTTYHFISFEFRTDNLWAPLWLLCVTMLISGASTRASQR